MEHSNQHAGRNRLADEGLGEQTRADANVFHPQGNASL